MYDDDPNFSVTDYQVYLRTEIIILIFGPDALLNDDDTYANNPSKIDQETEDVIQLLEESFPESK